MIRFSRQALTPSSIFDRLWIKLTGAFALVIVVGIIVTVVLARQGTATRFAHYMVNDQMLQPAQLQQFATDYYQQQNGWEGVGAALNALVGGPTSRDMRGMMEGMIGNMMGMVDNRVQIVDAAEHIVADTRSNSNRPPRAGTSIQQWPLVVDGQQIGLLRVEGSMMGMSSVDDGTLLSGVTRAVLVAGLVAGIVALLLSGLLVRQITRPLVSLAQASQRIANGELSVHVPVQSHDELGELAATFNQMASSLQTQETLRRNLMADIAHELRTPLASIQGTVEALQDGIFPLTADNLGPIHQEVSLLNRLVEDLRTLANAEAGKLSLNKTPIDLVDLTQHQVAAFHYRAVEEEIDLLLEVDAQLPTIEGDEQRLSQVLANLLDNALRHTLADGMVQVRLSSVKSDAQVGVQIAVRDSGEGIPADELPHLFDRFYRVDRSRSRRTGGSGLGLAIARQIVEAHGGEIWAESPPVGEAHGSEFSLFLPVYVVENNKK